MLWWLSLSKNEKKRHFLESLFWKLIFKAGISHLGRTKMQSFFVPHNLPQRFVFFGAFSCFFVFFVLFYLKIILERGLLRETKSIALCSYLDLAHPVLLITSWKKGKTPIKKGKVGPPSPNTKQHRIKKKAKKRM